MKRKILAVLAILVLCLTPTFFFAGCEEDNSTTINYTTWSVSQNGSFASSTVSGLSIKYSFKAYDATEGKYRWVSAISDDGKYTFTDTETQIEITSLDVAIERGLTHSGFDSSKKGTDFKMKIYFGGVAKEITYSVT